MKKYNIGDVVGSNNALLILDKFKDKHNKTRYKVECQICKKDPELFGEAIYEATSDYFKTSKLPCGCSKSKKYTKHEWTVLIKRKAESNNHIFHGYVVDSEKVNQDSKLKLECKTCAHIWESCSIGNYTRDRSCPKCADISRGLKKNTEASEWLRRFRATGLFPEEQYSFERTSETGRLWKVLCTKCEGLEFFSDRSNLVAGKIPCNCSKGGGYDSTKPGYFYILEVQALGTNFLKFGISNFPKRRIVGHKRNLSTIGGEIIKQRFFIGDGEEVLSIESMLKKTLQIENKYIDGFKREACSLDCLSAIEKAIEHLTEVYNLKV